MAESGVRVLFIEDEKKIAGAVCSALIADGYGVAATTTAEEGFYLLHNQEFDLVLLDLMLPIRSGLEILKDMRRWGLKVPVLILTSKDSIEDRVVGLDAGADDYMVKPFAIPELLARVRALVRRGKKEGPNRLRFQLSDLEVDVSAREARRSTQLLDLTAKEFSLLEYLLMNEGRVVSREMLARDVWKETSRHTPIDNVIDVQIARLRRKIDDPFPNKLLHTVRGIGFVLREDKE
jgi:two-component system, OmpR family, copper resistance phosphate regulon response regulator CusR